MKKLLYLSCAFLLCSAQQAISADSDGVSVKSAKRQSSSQHSGTYLGSQQKWTTNRQARVHAYRSGEEAYLYEKKQTGSNNKEISKYEADSVGTRQHVSTAKASSDEDIKNAAIPQVTMPYVLSDHTLDSNSPNDQYRPVIATNYDEDQKSKKTTDIYRALDPYTYSGEFFIENIQGGTRANAQFNQATTHLYVKGSNYEGRLGAHDGKKEPTRKCTESNPCDGTENPLFIDKNYVGSEYQLIYTDFVDVLYPGGPDVKLRNLTDKNFVIIDGTAHGTGATFLTANRQLYSLGSSSIPSQFFRSSYFSTNVVPQPYMQDDKIQLAPNRLAYIGGMITTVAGDDDLRGKEKDIIISDNNKQPVIPYRLAAASEQSVKGQAIIPKTTSVDWYAILGAYDKSYGKYLYIDASDSSISAVARSVGDEVDIDGNVSANRKVKKKATQLIDMHAIDEETLLAVGDDNFIYSTKYSNSGGLQQVRELRPLNENKGEIFVSVKGFKSDTTIHIYAKSNRNTLYHATINGSGRTNIEDKIDNVGKYCTNYNWGMYTKINNDSSRETSVIKFSSSDNEVFSSFDTHFPGQRVFDIACGVNHALAIVEEDANTKKRVVKGWGSNSHFQLTSDLSDEEFKNSMTRTLRRPSYTWVGEWDEHATYSHGDVVLHNGALYVWKERIDKNLKFGYPIRDYEERVSTCGGKCNQHVLREREWMDKPYDFASISWSGKSAKDAPYGPRPGKRTYTEKNLSDVLKNAIKNYEPGNLKNFAEENKELAWGANRNRIYHGGEVVWLDYHGGEVPNDFRDPQGKHKILWFISNYGYAECYGDDCYCGGKAIGYQLEDGNNNESEYGDWNEGLIAANRFKKCRCFNVATKEDKKDEIVNGMSRRGDKWDGGVLPGPLNLDFNPKDEMDIVAFNEKLKKRRCNAPIEPWAEAPPLGWERITDSYVEFRDDYFVVNKTTKISHPYPYSPFEIVYYRDLPYILDDGLDTKDYAQSKYLVLEANIKEELSSRNFFARARFEKLLTKLNTYIKGNGDYDVRNWNTTIGSRKADRSDEDKTNYLSTATLKGNDTWDILSFGLSIGTGNKNKAKKFYEKAFVIETPVVVYKDGMRNLNYKTKTNGTKPNGATNDWRNEEIKGIPVRVFAGLNSTYIHTIEINKKQN